MTCAVEAGEHGGRTKATVTSAPIPGSRSDAEFRGGVVYIVSGFKTSLETGEPIAVG